MAGLNTASATDRASVGRYRFGGLVMRISPVELLTDTVLPRPLFDAKSSGPVSDLDERQSVDRRVPLILRPLQGKLQLSSAACAASHQDQPTKRNGYPDDHPNR